MYCLFLKPEAKLLTGTASQFNPVIYPKAFWFQMASYMNSYLSKLKKYLAKKKLTYFKD